MDDVSFVTPLVSYNEFLSFVNTFEWICSDKEEIMRMMYSSSKEGALAFFRKNLRKYLRKYLRYFWDCAQNIVNNCGLLCNAYNFVFWSVNLSANIYDISRIALKIS